MDCSPTALLAAARCFRCINGMQWAVRSYLLCEWANNLCDPDAQKFIDYVGEGNLTETEKAAVCALVHDLKYTVPANTPAVSFWDREIIIYPFVGRNNYNVQRVNLRNPGTFNFTNGLTAPTYSALGITGDPGGDAWVDTGFAPSASGGTLFTLNSARVMWYVQAQPTFPAASYFGAQNAVGGIGAVRALAPVVLWPAQPDFIYDVHCNATNIAANNSTGLLGMKVVQRIAELDVRSNFDSLTWKLSGQKSTSQTTSTIFLLMTNNTTPFLGSDCTLSGFSLGSPLDNVTPQSELEYNQYKAIWDKFETALGRGHP